MRTSTLLARNLAWYWRTNLAVLLGVATAAGVLGGALLVGDSVRTSLRDLVLARLGNTDYVVARNGFFREELAAAFGKTGQEACPTIAVNGMVAHPASGRRALAVQIYGVDQRFGAAPEGAADPAERRAGRRVGRQSRRRAIGPGGEAFRDSARIAARPEGGRR